MTEIDSTHSYDLLSQQFHIVDTASQQSENVAAPRPQFGVLTACQSFLDCNPMLILRRQNWRVVSSAICKVLSWRWARDLPLWPDRSIFASKPNISPICPRRKSCAKRQNCKNKSFWNRRANNKYRKTSENRLREKVVFLRAKKHYTNN